MIGVEEKLLYHWVLYDKDGNVKARSRPRRARSFLIAHLQHLRAMVNNAQEASVVDVLNVSYTIKDPDSAVLFYTAAVSGSDRGITMGTDDTAVTITDYALGALIAAGAGAGQLSYGAQTIGSVGGSGSSRRFTITRTATNNSGGDITVKEIGLAVGTSDSGATTRNFLVTRDVLAAPVTMNDTDALAVVYTYKVTV
jgi:hypothetical protein